MTNPQKQNVNTSIQFNNIHIHVSENPTAPTQRFAHKSENIGWFQPVKTIKQNNIGSNPPFQGVRQRPYPHSSSRDNDPKQLQELDLELP